MEAVNVFCLLEGDVLAKDVYKGNSLILKADTYLTRESITKLKKWKINAVEIKSPAETEEFDLAASLNISPYLPTPPLSILKRVFFENLTQVGHEYRYGSVLYEANDYQWLESLFIKFMSNSTSALTLERPHRQAFDTPAAQQLLIEEINLVDENLLHEFFLMLDIYPLNTIVELTNGTWAKVANANIRMPFFPVLLNVDNSSTFHIPLNKSLKVAKIIKFNEYE